MRSMASLSRARASFPWRGASQAVDCRTRANHLQTCQYYLLYIDFKFSYVLYLINLVFGIPIRMSLYVDWSPSDSPRLSRGRGTAASSIHN